MRIVNIAYDELTQARVAQIWCEVARIEYGGREPILSLSVSMYPRGVPVGRRFADAVRFHRVAQPGTLLSSLPTMQP